MKRLRALVLVLVLVIALGAIVPARALAGDAVPARGVYDASVAETLPTDETFDFTFSYVGKGERYGYVWIHVKVAYASGGTHEYYYKVPGSNEWPADGTDVTATVDFREPIGVESQVTWRIAFGGIEVNNMGGFDSEATEATGEFLCVPGPVTVTLHGNGIGDDYEASVPYGARLADEGTSFGSAGITSIDDLPRFVDGYVRVGWAKEPVDLSQVTYGNYFSSGFTLRSDLDLYAVWLPATTAIDLDVEPLLCGTRVMKSPQQAGSEQQIFWTMPPASASAPSGSGYRVEDMAPILVDAQSDPAPGFLMWYTLDAQGRKVVFEGTVVGGESYSFDCDVSGLGAVAFAEADDVTVNGDYDFADVTSTQTSGEYRLGGQRANVTSHAYASITMTAEHDWGDWEVVTAPTATTNGLERRVCSGCGEEETKVLPAGIITEVAVEFTRPQVSSWVRVTEGGDSKYFDVVQDPAPQVSVPEGQHFAFDEAFFTDINWKAETTDFYYTGNGGDAILFLEAEDGWEFSSDAVVTVENGTVVLSNPFRDSNTGKSMFVVRFSFRGPGPWSVTAGATDGGEVQISSFRRGRYAGPLVFAHGSNMTVTAYPDEGYRFVGWYEGVTDASAHVIDNTGELVSTDARYAFVLEEGVVLQAVFEPGFESPFIDVTEATYHAGDINWMYYSGVSRGWETPAGREYRPMEAVARCDMAEFLYRLAGEPAFEPTEGDMGRFADVTASTPHARAIWWLASTGVSTGYGDGTFRPYGRIVRCDMAAFLFRLSALRGRADPGWQPTGDMMAAFSDVSASTYHLREVLWLADTGVSAGYPDGTFRPANDIVRCDMAAFLHRMYERGLV